FCPGGARPPTQVMVRYIDDHKDRFGVEPICRQLQVAPSTYYEQKRRQRDPSRLPARAQRDTQLRCEIHRVWHENFCAHGVRKTWKQLNRERIRVARCTVRRLMRGPYCTFTGPRRDLRTVLRDSPVSRMICRIERPCRSNTLISTACSWVNISTARKKPPSSPRGVKITSAGVGQFYFGDDTYDRDRTPGSRRESGTNFCETRWITVLIYSICRSVT